MKKLLIIGIIFGVFVTSLLSGCGGGGGGRSTEPIPASPTGTNLLTYGDFEAANLTDHWRAYNNPPATTPTFERVNGIPGFNGYCAHFKATNCGEVLGSGYSQIRPGSSTPLDISLSAGKKYRISIRIRTSSANGYIYTGFNLKNDLTFTPLLDLPVTTTNTSTNVYTSTATYNPSSNETVNLYIGFANKSGSTANNNVDFWIDDVMILEE